MTFKKPYRICNTAPAPLPETMEVKTHCITATLKELQDRYELRISIPDSGHHDFTVFIKNSILYVYKGKEAAPDPDNLVGYFPLPANVQQEAVKAFYRSYGLKVVMPVCTSDGKVLHVPVLID